MGEGYPTGGDILQEVHVPNFAAVGYGREEGGKYILIIIENEKKGMFIKSFC